MKVNSSKVNNPALNPTSLSGSKIDKSKAKAGGNATAQEIASSTKLNLSTDAQAVQKAKSIASQDSIDEAKVARLQKLIDEGKYRVDAEAVADRLVDEHLLMGEP